MFHFKVICCVSILKNGKILEVIIRVLIFNTDLKKLCGYENYYMTRECDDAAFDRLIQGFFRESNL